MNTLVALAVVIIICVIAFVAWNALGAKNAGKSGYASGCNGGYKKDLEREGALNQFHNDTVPNSGTTGCTTGCSSIPLPRSRTGGAMAPDIIGKAEQSAWATSTPSEPSSWVDTIGTVGVDARTLTNHQDWAREVGNKSQGARTCDNLDEAVAMSIPRQGIRAFSIPGPTQGPCTSAITEIDPALLASNFGPVTM